MSLTLKNRVFETTSSTGTGAYLLAGVVNASCRPFADAGNGGKIPYLVEQGTKSEWGIGTYDSGTNTLARTTILGNYLGTTAAINWSAGTKNIYSPDLVELFDWLTFSDTFTINTITLAEAAAPSTPASGFGAIYAKSDGLLYWRNDAGTEIDLTGGGLTAEQVDDRVAALVIAGTNMTVTYDDNANTLTLDAASGGLTGEEVDDRVAGLLVAGDNVTLDYDDNANTLTINSSGGGGTSQNEIQRITITGNPDGGTFLLSLGVSGATLAWDVDAVAIDTAVEAFSAIGSGNLTTTGGDLPGAFVDVEFSGGAVAATDIDEMTIDTTGLTKTAPSVVIETITEGSSPVAAVDEQQEFTLYGSPTGGSFVASIAGYGSTGTIAFDADNATIEAAFESMGILFDATVTGGPLPNSPVQVEMSLGTNMPQMTIDVSGLTGGSVSATITTTQDGVAAGIPEPVSYWQCEETSGDLEDYYANHSLTASGTPGTATGLIGEARYMEPANYDFFRSNDSEFQSSTNFTVCGWIKFSTLPGAGEFPVVMYAFGTRLTVPMVRCYSIEHEVDADTWRFKVMEDDFQNTGDLVSVEIVNALVEDEWLFLAMSFDRATKELRCSVNGGDVSSATMVGDPYVDDGTGDGFIMSPGDTAELVIDEWGWWNEVLSDDQILELYNAGAGTTAPFDGGSPLNEIQQLATTGTPTQGTFTLTFDGETTSALDFDASAAEVDAALEALSNIGSGDVTCTGGPLPTPIDIEFIGALAATDVVEITVNDDLLQYSVTTLQDGSAGTAGVDEEQEITLAPDVTGGDFTLDFDGETTAAIPFDATSSEVFDALVALTALESADIVVTGGPLPNTAVSITFTGATWGEQNVDEMTGDAAGLTQDPIVGTITTIQNGGGGGSVNLPAYVHTQVSASTTWTINHNLGRNPLINLIVGGHVIWPDDIEYVTNDQVVVTFLSAVSGTANCY